MKQLTSKLTSFVTTGLLIAGVLLAMTFASSFRNIYLHVMQASSRMGTTAEAAPATRSPVGSSKSAQASGQAAPAGDSSPVGTAPGPSPAADPVGYLGHWHAMWNSPKQGLCEISIEVNAGELGHYLAYPNFSCIPISPLLDPESKAPASAIALPLGKLNPASAILTGDLKGGSLVFEVTKITSANDTGCVLNSPFTLTLFGSNQVASEFHDACGGGSVLLTRQK